MDDTTTTLQLWNIALTVASIIGAAMWMWLVFFVKREINKIDAMGTAFIEHRMDLVTNYSTKNELRDTTTRLERRIDDGFTKIDTKLDLVFERIDRKADKP